jgi:lipoic acid synthetase
MADKKPEWLKIKINNSTNVSDIKKMLSRLSLHTVCEEANCPNQMECFGKRTATFMIMGRICSRNCQFCNVESNHPTPLDNSEPEHIAEAVKELKLKHVVITSVTRDDLPDGGTLHFAETIKAVKRLNTKVIVEVLIPDFKGDEDGLKLVIDAGPEIINHNVETVPRLYPEVRPQADYRQSLDVIKNVKKQGMNIFSKSGIMIGLGETKDEVLELFRDLRKADCDILTVGQYLAPSKKHYPVSEYIHPDVFAFYKEEAEKMGFKSVASGPFVRSSYNAAEVMEKAESQKNS